jgi:hypothetical protein
METNKQGQPGFRFYNAGSKLDEQWPFSISPTSAGFNPEDGQGAHSIGKWNFVAPKEAWCFIPIEILSGHETLRVNFIDDAKRKYGRRGLVMLDPRHDPATEDPEKALETYPLAPTEALVIERAERLWDGFLESICQSHFDDVQNAMAQGNRPRAAAGFTVHALKMKGYRDPAADFLKGLRDGKSGGMVQAATSPELIGIVKGLAEQSRVTTQLLIALASGKGVDPDLLKAIMSPPAEAPAIPGTVKPVKDYSADPAFQARAFAPKEDGWTKGEGNLDKGTIHEKAAPVSKKERAAAAAKEL